jgi:hypothetical protein
MNQSMPSAASSSPDDLSSVLRDLLGYLNFSHGAPNGRFRACVNELFRHADATSSPEVFCNYLLDQLEGFRAAGEPVFTDIAQAGSVIQWTLRKVQPAYRKHHSDLLAHLPESEFFTPFLAAKMFEAVLEAGEPWSDDQSDRIVSAALRTLNSFIGYRPVAVLENGRRMEVYEHERFCPIPLYLQDAGTANGRYHELIDAMLTFMKSLPAELTEPAHFSLARLSELALDVRAHDHLHPVNKRTNYVFGEWDPELIDTKGFYRRFVIRRLILDSLLDWTQEGGKKHEADRLFDAAVVLCGTILMASAISGSGPQTWDSSVSLTTLLPIVARQRDNFYQTLLDETQGENGKRLKRLAKATRQPFGHVRHELNMQLAKYGADQVQHRHLSWMYATMGFEEASCEEASVIPCLSARFESDIQSRIVMIRRFVRARDLEASRRLMSEVMDLTHRGIHCGAIVDPWNILGFQGQFPLFFAREDSIPDNRVDILLELTEQTFDACSLIMSEAAAAGMPEIHDAVLRAFSAMAEQWDRYATTTVNDLTQIHGMQSVKAATLVARALAEWRTAGESAGDISFWRQHVEDFEVTSSFAQVVSTLLERKDHVAALGLLMHWLSRADTIRLENGGHSIHVLLHRLMHSVCADPDEAGRWNMLRRLFAFMEANAGSFWEVPSLTEFAARQKKKDRSGNEPEGESESLDLQHLFDGDDSETEDNLFEAAWDEVTYRDSTDDGNNSDTIDEGYAPGTSEFEVLYRQIEPRLKFLHSVGSLWGLAAVSISRTAAGSNVITADQKDHLREWLRSIRECLKGLGELVTEVQEYQISTFSSDLEANLEYDVQLQCRFLLMQNVLSTTVEYLMAERLIGAVIAEHPADSRESSSLDAEVSRMLSAVFARDTETAGTCFPALCRELRKRPLLYVPFENGGQPGAILKARTLQAIIRVLLSQLPRMGLLDETFQLLQTALQMEKTSRPLGQAVTEFDRLFRIGLASSVEAILHSASRWRTRSTTAGNPVFRRIHRLLEAYSDLWTRHSGSMRLSVIEDLHDDDRAAEVKEFISNYGEDLFHTRMLTLGNARAIVHNGAEALLEELQNSIAPLKPVQLLEDIEMGIIDHEEAVELAEFVYEAVVDNFERFLEYNTTTTYSDYGNRLYCLLDFVRLEALYDRFDWNTIPWQIAHETMVRFGSLELAGEVEEFLTEETRQIAESFVHELIALEKEYGVRLPTLHDHICERIVGGLVQNRMTALVAACCMECRGMPQDEQILRNFTQLRSEIADYMSNRIGSGIEPPEWMQRLASEMERVQDGKSSWISESLYEGEFLQMTQKVLDKQLSSINQRNERSKPRY